MMKKVALLLGVLVLTCGVAQAVPSLQLYIDGGTYDAVTETWVASSAPFTLFAAGSKKPNCTIIDEVLLYISVSQADYNTAGAITIMGAIGEPANVLAVNELLGSGGTPPDANSPGTPPDLSPHGIFPAYYWAVSLPDLLVGSAGETVPDYQPGETGFADGDIQRYIVSVSGFETVHFDLTGRSFLPNGKPKINFAPYSHDAEYGDGKVPEPSTLLLLGMGIAVVVPMRRRWGRK